VIARQPFCNLQVDDDAPPEVIKMAYRALAKSCHPDFLGQKGHNVCILLNEVRLC
jgi:DnaJ-class molecular chaperone